jgi:hypothetical protein
VRNVAHSQGWTRASRGTSRPRRAQAGGESGPDSETLGFWAQAAAATEAAAPEETTRARGAPARTTQPQRPPAASSRTPCAGYEVGANLQLQSSACGSRWRWQTCLVSECCAHVSAAPCACTVNVAKPKSPHASARGRNSRGKLRRRRDGLTPQACTGESISGVEPREAASSGGAHVTLSGTFNSTAAHSCRFADVRNALNSMTGVHAFPLPASVAWLLFSIPLVLCEDPDRTLTSRFLNSCRAVFFGRGRPARLRAPCMAILRDGDLGVGSQSGHGQRASVATRGPNFFLELSRCLPQSACGRMPLTAVGVCARGNTRLFCVQRRCKGARF